ncbi:DUF1127 domain-containing protein [Mangrovicoccus sp. HB161399]|uniref:DUF1127 domain-containing protein n=1 Tax=Mangrovicoccus sp. HB161399 TaxID=2720392 RepID=UPI00155564C1|nr:DUF1127 domain-containing protein [Mangrovicoccus sp. HB161399]
MTDQALSQAARPGRFPRLPRPARFFALRRQRRQLRQLDAHLLRDLGLTRAQAEREAQKPFWDAPDWWK